MQMRTTTANTQTKPPNPSYSPSVPVYVYRELVTELQAAQAKLDVVTNHNQKLSQENKQLRQEINTLVQSCLQMQKRLESSEQSSQSYPHSHFNVNNIPGYQSPSTNNVEVKNTPVSQSIPRNPEIKSSQKPSTKKVSSPRQPTPQKSQKTHRESVVVPMIDMNFPASEPMFIEEQEVRYYVSPESEAKGLSGWWLAMTILLIMVTGFGAGYLVVRPLLQNQTQNSSN